MTDINLPVSVLTKDQARTYVRYSEDNMERVIVHLRFDDRCGNGHNTFSATCDIYELAPHGGWEDSGGGADHETIAKMVPEVAPFLKWHLCSTDGPLHYVANTIYHAKQIDKDQGQFFVYLNDPECKINRELLGIYSADELVRIRVKYPTDVIETEIYPNPMAKEPNLEAARRSAIWPDATLKQLRDEDALLARLPALMQEFKHDMEALGFTY